MCASKKKKKKKRKNRTIIVYFGILIEYLEIIGNCAKYIRIVAVVMARAKVEHKQGCPCKKGCAPARLACNSKEMTSGLLTMSCRQHLTSEGN